MVVRQAPAVEPLGLFTFWQPEHTPQCAWPETFGGARGHLIGNTMLTQEMYRRDSAATRSMRSSPGCSMLGAPVAPDLRAAG